MKKKCPLAHIFEQFLMSHSKCPITISFSYSMWSSTNTIFKCISLLSFTFLFPFFPIFLGYTKIWEIKFSHKFHISVAPTDNRHKNQLTTTTQCTTAASCYHRHHCYCLFPLPTLFCLPLQIICLLLPQLFLLSADIAALPPICFLPPTLLLQRCRCRWLFAAANIQRCRCSVCWRRLLRRQQELGGAKAIHTEAPPA